MSRTKQTMIEIKVHRERKIQRRPVTCPECSELSGSLFTYLNCEQAVYMSNEFQWPARGKKYARRYLFPSKFVDCQTFTRQSPRTSRDRFLLPAPFLFYFLNYSVDSGPPCRTRDLAVQINYKSIALINWTFRFSGPIEKSVTFVRFAPWQKREVK